MDTSPEFHGKPMEHLWGKQHVVFDKHIISKCDGFCVVFMDFSGSCTRRYVHVMLIHDIHDDSVKWKVPY